ncbi:2917_t:CDS:2, partial [Racocetra fulgida]
MTNKGSHNEVVLLTDDVGNRTKAQEEGLLAFSELVDILENSSNAEGDKKILYDEGSILSNVNGVDTQIMILGRPCLNRAIQGDVVAVQLLPKSEWLRTPTAVVVEEEEEANVTADLKEDGEPKEQNDELENEPSQPTGKVVGIIKRNWRPYPWGHYVRALGAAGDKSTETEVLLLEHDVPFQSFASQVLKDLPIEGESWRVTEEHFHGRADLRHLNVCSIDPPGCTDIDDALHVRPLPNGNYENLIYISFESDIADVTHFVKPFTAMDEEAANRGTTVYLELTADAEIVNVNFTKSLISSRASLTYEEAQILIDDPRKQDDLTKGLRILNQLAKQLHKRRIDRGAITLSSPEVRFQLDFDSQDPVD